MKEFIIILPLCLAMTHSAYAGFSIGMPGAVIKHVEKLDAKIKKTKPGGVMVLVPGNLSLGTNDFYVMEYEASNVGGEAFSRYNENPWVNINLPGAIAACAAIGAGSHLLTIAEAQTINRNIEAQAANWANGVIGSLVSAGGGLKRGNVGLNDSASTSVGGPQGANSGRGTSAILVLSNGGVLWDWSGNAWEWVYGAGSNGSLGVPNGVTFSASALIDWNSATLNEERPIFGPSNISWTSNNGIGKYLCGGTTNGVVRGGSYNHGVNAGVFAINANIPTSYTAADVGFRCARPK